MWLIYIAIFLVLKMALFISSTLFYFILMGNVNLNCHTLIMHRAVWIWFLQFIFSTLYHISFIVFIDDAENITNKLHGP